MRGKVRRQQLARQGSGLTCSGCLGALHACSGAG
jgi:hypothetical protein